MELAERAPAAAAVAARYSARPSALRRRALKWAEAAALEWVDDARAWVNRSIERGREERDADKAVEWRERKQLLVKLERSGRNEP